MSDPLQRNHDLWLNPDYDPFRVGGRTAEEREFPEDLRRAEEEEEQVETDEGND